MSDLDELRAEVERLLADVDNEYGSLLAPDCYHIVTVLEASR